jgi:uncharacterized protein YrrD
MGEAMSAPDAAGTADRIVLVRGTELSGLPVVSILGGEALADIKDVLYSPDEGRIVGFTLNKRGGLFAGPLKTGLSMEAVWAIGRDAVMVVDANALAEVPGRATHASRNVLGNAVLTDVGDRLGEVTDLIVEVGVIGPGSGSSSAGSVVGYQLVGDTALQGREGHQLFIPLPYALAVSGQNLIVPSTVAPFIRDDLSGFGGAVSEFRDQLDHPPGGSVSPGAPAALSRAGSTGAAGSSTPSSSGSSGASAAAGSSSSSAGPPPGPGAAPASLERGPEATTREVGR